MSPTWWKPMTCSPTSARRSTPVTPPPPPESNPYLAAAPEEPTGPKRKSMHRSLQFHRPGRYILEAEQIRRERIRSDRIRFAGTVIVAAAVGEQDGQAEPLH